MITEKRNFLEGMNGDVSQRLLGMGQSLNLMNCRVAVTEHGRDYRVENVPGTLLVEQNVFPPYGTNQNIGSTVDLARNRLIYFNYNTAGDHGIYCYVKDTGITYAVLYDSQVIGGLNFSKTSRIDRNAKVIGDLLYWTDNNNEPRRINIEAGIKMNHASYVTDVLPYSYPMNQSVITVIRRPFEVCPSVQPLLDGTRENFLNDFSGEFAVRFVYRDNERSVMTTNSSFVNYRTNINDFSFITTANFIRVALPNSFVGIVSGNYFIEQDVQIIQIAVRYNNTPGYFVIKEWNKSNPADLAEIIAYNAVTGSLSYDFYNDVRGVPISDADSVKPADSVPIKAKTVELGIDRLFFANYIKGYDAPAITSLTGTTTQQTFPDGFPRTIFKSYATYQIGIRFRDNYKRQSTVVTNDNLIIEIPDRGDYNDKTFTTAINWALSNANALNEIPDYAYYADLVITKNLRTRFFLQSLANGVQYAIKDADGSITYQNTYTGSVFGLAIGSTTLLSTGMFPSFAEGDMVRIYPDGATTFYTLRVIQIEPDYIIVRPVNLGDLTSISFLFYEYFTPYKTSASESFYTVGQTVRINNPGTNSRQYNTLSGSFTGDVTYGVRVTTIFSISYFTENMSPNDDHWMNWYGIYGEANIVSLLGQELKENFVQWSNTIIKGTQTNGLSTFDALDEKVLPFSMGAVSKLQVASKIQEEGNIMLAIGEKSTVSMYLSEVQVVGASTNAFLASSPGVIGTVNNLKGNYGTINPESVIEYLGLVFWFDMLNGTFVQYSAEGLEPVSNYGEMRFFQNYAQKYLVSSTAGIDTRNGFHHIPTCIDPFHKEVICSLPSLVQDGVDLPSYSVVPIYAVSVLNRFDISDYLAKTMTFQFGKNKWGSNFEFLGEWYDYIQTTMYGFKNGALYIHNHEDADYNQFYGPHYPVRICCTANLNPSALKDLFNIAIESNAAPDFTVAYADYPNVQITDLTVDDYTDQQGQFYAEFFKDRLSPNVSGTPDEKLYIGDGITDIAIKIMLEFQQYSNLFYCNFVDIGYDISKGQQVIASPTNK